MTLLEQGCRAGWTADGGNVRVALFDLTISSVLRLHLLPVFTLIQYDLKIDSRAGIMS